MFFAAGKKVKSDLVFKNSKLADVFVSKFGEKNTALIFVKLGGGREHEPKTKPFNKPTNLLFEQL